MKKVLCIYHSEDLDGWASGAIMLKRYKELGHNHEVMIHGWNYGDRIPMDLINAHDEIIITDVAFPIDVMVDISNRKSLYWYDHHEIIKDERLQHIKGKRSQNRSSCQLVAEAYKYESLVFETLSDYDNHNDPKSVRFEEFVLPFQFFMQSRNYDISTSEGYENWETVFKLIDMGSGNTFVNDGVHIGKYIYDYYKQINRDFGKKFAFPLKIAGYRAICINSPMRGSMGFDSYYDPRKHDIKVRFNIDKDRMVDFSVYSEEEKNIDCNKICKLYGGGGHKGSGGFKLSLKDFQDMLKRG